MRVLVYCFLLAVSSCYGNSDCLTSSGISIFADDDVLALHACADWEATTKQFIVDYSTYARVQHYALPPSAVASAVYGITMTVVTESFACDYPKGCSGFADHRARHIDLAIHPELCKQFPVDVSCRLCDSNYSAYFHELSHFVMCFGLYICDASTDNNWHHDHYLMQFEDSYFNVCKKAGQK